MERGDLQGTRLAGVQALSGRSPGLVGGSLARIISPVHQRRP
ncbi:hypothetical protein [Deinococcus wulumuqiensis]|nr:hypothetical protein [Deinococcus wulumuqiensis]